MSQNKILTKPAKIAEISFDELYQGFTTDWEKRAQKLRARRWRQLKHKLI